MKVKYLKSRVLRIENVLSNEEENDFPSTLVIKELLSIAQNFVDIAQEHIVGREVSTEKDSWLLSAFELSKQDEEFIQVFAEICKECSSDIDALYSLSCSFFYRKLLGNDLFTIELYRKILKPLISNENLTSLEKKLKKHKLF